MYKLFWVAVPYCENSRENKQAVAAVGVNCNINARGFRKAYLDLCRYNSYGDDATSD